MKKSILTIGSLAISVFSFAQVLTYVGNGALVTINQDTLFYTGGGWQNDDTAVVNNTGNVMVEAASTDLFSISTVAGTDFRLKYVDKTTFGQLYISGIPQGNISGIVNKDYTADVNHSSDLNNLGRQQVSLPFFNYTIGDLKRDLGNYINVTNTALNYAGRFNVASVFKWNNSKARFDQISGADATIVGKPSDYYILPRRSQSPDGQTSTLEWDAAGSLKTFSGTPSSDEATNSKVTINGAPDKSGLLFGYNGYNKNAFYERYNTYIADPFRTGGGWSSSWEADYGYNLYQFANPFLINLDLKYIGHNEGSNGDGVEIPGLVGVATLGANSINWNRPGSFHTVTNMHTSTASGGVLQAGDIDALLIKPMGEYFIKMDNPSNVDYNMNNNRWFPFSLRNSNTYGGPTGKTTANIPSNKIVKQVAVILRDSSGNELGRTYYAVSPSAITGYTEDPELRAYVMDFPIYTKEELPNGGEDINQAGKLYINAANEIDFAGKEIPLMIENEQANHLSFEIYEAGNKLTDGENLSTGKSFYIKVNNDLTQIDTNTTVPYISGNYSLYYDKPSGVLANSNANLSQTVIAKKDNQWVIRFAKNWKSAKVEVYSATGQLIHLNKEVKTTNDYIIPINADGFYVVKTTSEKGDVVTKKIIK